MQLLLTVTAVRLDEPLQRILVRMMMTAFVFPVIPGIIHSYLVERETVNVNKYAVQMFLQMNLMVVLVTAYLVM